MPLTARDSHPRPIAFALPAPFPAACVNQHAHRSFDTILPLATLYPSTKISRVAVPLCAAVKMVYLKRDKPPGRELLCGDCCGRCLRRFGDLTLRVARVALPADVPRFVLAVRAAARYAGFQGCRSLPVYNGVIHQPGTVDGHAPGCRLLRRWPLVGTVPLYRSRQGRRVPTNCGE